MSDTTTPDAARLAGRRVVLGVSGGIAAYKAPLVARLLIKAGATVDAVLTRGAEEFVGAATFEGLTGRPVRRSVWEDIDRETHVALAREADAILVFPATAHLMAKAAGGLADDLLTTTLLAATCPVVLCPAMHTEMWEHPATQANAQALHERGVVLAGPATGELMGGDTGTGRAIEPEQAVEALVAALTASTAGRNRELAGTTVVVSAGGTREPIDPVRFLGNPSSGKMGFALAAEAAARGATVHLVAGPTHLATPDGVTRHDVRTALDMHAQVTDLVPDADIVVMAAAVADFRPKAAAGQKIKKANGVPTIELVRNPDILAELGQRRADGNDRPFLVGFAAETEQVEQHAAEKLARKNAHVLVVNDVSASDAGFSVDTNQVFILDEDGGRTDVPHGPKAEVARGIWDAIVKRRAPRISGTGAGNPDAP